MDAGIAPETSEFYRQAMSILRGAEVPFLVGGAYAMERYTGIARHTKDFDVFVRPRDAPAGLAALADAGYRTALVHPHWLGKAYSGDAYVDVIFRSGNAVAEVDDGWFAHAVQSEVLGMSVDLCPAEEIVWSKSYVMERERFDGADVAHLIRARAESLDWLRLLDRFGPHWRVLFAHLVLFGFVYPSERTRIPEWMLRELGGRVSRETSGTAGETVCQGTLLSRSQYLVDLSRWGYQDPRLKPRGAMTPEDVAHWTDAIAVDGQW